jgi:cysteinyl-tRNA synthetase
MNGMTLRVHNTLTRKKEIFKPMDGKNVKMFVCGPTVYDSSHLGHAKTYVQFDIIVRYMRYRGFDVYYLQNITDLDDKIIDRAKEKDVTPESLARKHEEEYHKDMKDLGIDSVSKYARATDYIEPIIKQVKTLLDKGFAYEIDDGIYYDLSRFPEYGKLSGRTTLEAEDAVSRIDESINKRNKGDFCLWKRSKPDEPKWDSPWFKGRPGWHIEDTAITESHYGPQYDVHGGARDLIFPHHEAEIAQMEAASGKKPFVKYWLHTGFLTVEGRKMAKSLGNFVTIRNVLNRYDAETVRYFFASAHYRRPINYSERNLQHSKRALERLYNTLEILQESAKPRKSLTKDEKIFQEVLEAETANFEAAMDDDFDAPKALSHLHTLSGKVNELMNKQDGEINRMLAERTSSTFKELGRVFGILQMEIRKEKLPEEAERLFQEREEARAGANYTRSDELRRQLEEQFGIIVEDTKKGTRWKKKIIG